MKAFADRCGNKKRPVLVRSLNIRGGQRELALSKPLSPAQAFHLDCSGNQLMKAPMMESGTGDESKVSSHKTFGG